VHFIGSSKLGVYNINRDLVNPTTGEITTFERGRKFFELSNHLGNVLVTLSDKKIGVDGNSDGVIDYYTADVITANDYYPGGMDMPGRAIATGNVYRYGFNGKENDKEIEGHQDYGFRIYDKRLVRFKSVDPLTKSYPELTPYQFASNSPIAMIDLDGLEGFVSISGNNMPGPTFRVQFDTDGDLSPNYDGSYFGAGAASLGGGLALVIDAALTKGLLTRTFLLSQGLGLAEHNRAKTPEGRKVQDERFKENFTDFAKNVGGGYIFGKLFQFGSITTSALAKTVTNRISFLKGFKGFRDDYIPYVDVCEGFFTRTYDKGAVLYQYQTAEGKLGNFFVESTGITQEQVGLLAKDYTKLVKIELKEKVETLVTKHIKGKEYFRDGKTITQGGGEQIFTTGISSKNATITEVPLPKK